MKKNLLLYIILGFLLVMNGFFLFKHFGTSDKARPQRHGQANFIADQLEFDATQLQKFEALDRAHREKINSFRSEIRASKDALFDKISDESFNDSEIEAISTEIANMEKVKALETFRFFSSVSEICNENQKKRFKTIIKDGLRQQGPADGNRPQNGLGREHRQPPPPKN
ncbi:MAG: hypothetical protein WBG90_10545 [Saonia sp.]